ncbi:Transcription factor [Niveomyces insectorum RCEF 264]|uniref:Transcription factor n=1 Tax=Niveomyces insectorum RCEF 264 TaxID=1081102 RepID=A0A167P5W4_9HYPO|nr:Transcription factor [Niveomyces insectorum RCEF 264]
MEAVSCVTCRRRKFGAACSYTGATSGATPGRRHHAMPTAATTQAGLPRRRISSSCSACKSAKSKCSGGVPCKRCVNRSLECVYENSRRDPASHCIGTRNKNRRAARAGSNPISPATESSPGDPPSDDAAAAARHGEQPLPSVPAWLLAPTLPPMDRLRALIDIYFARIHTVRCLGFLHMPAFLARIQDADSTMLYADEYGLVHAVCALAAPFHYANSAEPRLQGETSSAGPYYEAGAGWAATAMQRVFDHLGMPDIESLMTEMLVYEYYLRCGEYAKGFLLSGIIARHVQVLQLNLEYDNGVPCRNASGSSQTTSNATQAGVDGNNSSSSRFTWAEKECRRRLVWCCFLQDAFMECGIDQLRFVNPADIQVQLPCTEELFVRNTPCQTEMLWPGKPLPFAGSNADLGRREPGCVPVSDHGATPRGKNLDLRAFYIRAMAVRAKVLKYVKHLQGEVPWSVGGGNRRGSGFDQLDRELRELEGSVPDELRMTPENTCLFRWSGRLSLYFGVHILLAQTYNDLYRIGVANLVFPHHATLWIRTHAPADFLLRCHQMCRAKAVAIATLLEELWQTDKLALVDTPYAVHIQVCSSVLAMTISSWQALALRYGSGNASAETRSAPIPPPPPLIEQQQQQQHRRLLQSNVTILNYLRGFIKADVYYESARQALRFFDQLCEQGDGPVASAAEADFSLSPSGTVGSTVDPGIVDEPPAQYSLEYILNPLGVYPMARLQARDGHEPQASVPGEDDNRPRQAGDAHDNSTASSIGSIARGQAQSSFQHTPNTRGTVFDGAFVGSQPVPYENGTSSITMPTGTAQQDQFSSLDAPEAAESLFPMWAWESEVPTTDNMGYPTFLEAFPAPA